MPTRLDPQIPDGSHRPRFATRLRELAHRSSDLVVALAFVALLDVSIFHTGLYNRWIEPESYSGRTERTAVRLDRVQAKTTGPLILVIGDSTTGSAVLEVELQRTLREWGHEVTVINVALGGSTPRTWFHLLTHVEPWASAPTLLILGVFPDSVREFPNEVKPDLEIIKTRLRLRDVAWLPATYSERDARARAAFGALFRMTLFRPDLQSFFRNPVERWRAIRQEEHWRTQRRAGWTDENWSTDSLESARLGPEGTLDLGSVPNAMRDRPGALQDLQRLLRRRGKPPVRRVAAITPRNRQLLLDLLRHQQQRSVPVVMAITPWSAFPAEHHDISCFIELVEDARKQGIEISLFADSARQLEQPAYFRDLLHLNRRGATLFTEALADHLLSSGTVDRISTRQGQPPTRTTAPTAG